MSHNYYDDDEYEHFNYDYKHIFTGHGGKQRSKREAETHRHFDPCGHSRKIVTNLMNSAHNKRQQPGRNKA